MLSVCPVHNTTLHCAAPAQRDKYFCPPNIEPRLPNRIRINYFDSRKQVVAYLRTSKRSAHLVMPVLSKLERGLSLSEFTGYYSGLPMQQKELQVQWQLYTRTGTGEHKKPVAA